MLRLSSAESALAIGAALACVLVTGILWSLIASGQPLSPLPGIYRIEIPMLTLAAASAVLVESPSEGGIVWTAFGATAALRSWRRSALSSSVFPRRLLSGRRASSS